MKTSITDTLILTLVMGAVIFLCRVLPFLFFREYKNEDPPEKIIRQKTFLSFIEKIVPPAAMTVLAFNFISMPIKENPRDGITVLAASAITALIHLIRRNPLLSIFGGTAAFILLERFV